MSKIRRTTCTKITRTDLVIEGITSYDIDLTVGGQLYRSAAGYTPSGSARNTELRPDNIDLSGIIDGVFIVEEDIRAGRYDGARVEVLLVDPVTSTEIDKLLVGHVASWRIVNSRYILEIDELIAEYEKPSLKVHTLLCIHDLGSADCGFSLTPVTSSVTSQGSPANRVFIDSARTEADGHFDGGAVEFTSGSNNKLKRDVKTYILSTTTIELYEPLPNDIAGSVTYSMTRGCDKLFTTCRDVFNNVVPATGKGFGGYPYVPGPTTIIGKQTG